MLITAFLAALVALVLTAIGIPSFIMFFHKKRLGGQPTLEEVKQHASKSGTPTMGGLVFVVAALLVSALFALIFAQFTPMFITAWWV